MKKPVEDKTGKARMEPERMAKEKMKVTIQGG